MKEKLIILKDIPNVKWTQEGLVPVCCEHNLELDVGQTDVRWGWRDELEEDYWVTELRCLEGPHIIKLPMKLGEVRNYIKKKIQAKQYAESDLVDLDGLLVPVSKKNKVKVGETDYFITSQVKNSKRGDQVVIYAGKRGNTEKAQVFIDPGHRKMSFDQNNVNPADVFVKIEATFKDGTKHTLESSN